MREAWFSYLFRAGAS